MLTVAPFCVIPVAAGTGTTLLLVNVFPARRARDILMLMGLVFAGSIVLLLRFIQPERLLRVESLPDVTGFFATLQSPITPMLPSFWAGETLFASLAGGRDLLHAGALVDDRVRVYRAAERGQRAMVFCGLQQVAGGAEGALHAAARTSTRSRRGCPSRSCAGHLLVKDVKVFLRDVTQWSQLLLLLALVVVYLYNFQVLDLDRIPYMAGFIKNFYAFLNLGLAAFVMATVAARFVFPAVSAEGAAFWIIRTAPITYRDFLWSKFWSGLVPLLLMSVTLTVVANEFLAVAPFLKVVTAAGITLMSFALVGLATGLGARYPRFSADNASQVAGISRRRRVHGCGGLVHHLDGRAARLAIVGVSVPDVAHSVQAVSHRRDRAHCRLLHGVHCFEYCGVALRHADGSKSTGRDGIAAGPKNRTRPTHPHPNAAGAYGGPA